ncbi:hypothetical protein L7F22_035139 [Adiantum nelumboides]|nr:hypothetical protein [Adiantum nelumboides]
MSTTFMPQNFYHHNASTAPQSFYTSASNSMQQEQRPPRPPYRPSNRPILCYRCGEYGHYQSKCALPEGSPPCHHCPDSKDHYSKDCPKQRASSSSGSTQNQQEFTFPKINLITVNTIPQPSPATHVVDPQQVEESAGVLTQAQRAALGLSLPARLSPPSPIPQHVSSNESLTGAISKPNSILSDIDGAFLEAMADLQQGNVPVQMPQDASNNMIKDTRGLSGGERSFSTLCFALALQGMTEAPFRAMDEFDVFMDAVSRKISLDTVVDFAVSHGSQWIFITPHDIRLMEGQVVTFDYCSG